MQQQPKVITDFSLPHVVSSDDTSDSRDPGAIEVVKLPALFACHTCNGDGYANYRNNRYWFAGSTRLCATCTPPNEPVCLDDPARFMWISDAKVNRGPIWLPRNYAGFQDKEIVARSIEYILLRLDYLHCPQHDTQPPDGGTAADFCKLANAQYGWERRLVRDALAGLVWDKHVYRFGKGVKGQPYRYVRRHWLCCKEATPAKAASDHDHAVRTLARSVT